MDKYKALQDSVCFQCLISLGAGVDSQPGPVNYSTDCIEVLHDGKPVCIPCNIDTDHILKKEFFDSLPQCPPSCVGPVKKDLGVSTIDEQGILEFMENRLSEDTGALVDTRRSELHLKGSIPGAINIPYTVFHMRSDSIELDSALNELGVERIADWAVAASGGGGKNSALAVPENYERDYEFAKELVVWSGGPMDSSATLAIMGLLDLGYPAERISYYHGGLQFWRAFGLNVVLSY
ncbi:MAG: rhodanese-like domain-containing protein [Gammaproteobacteria bacterium]|nr:rhodanese-like domain-containing protein [Gammaproteobacteria bacterium]